VGSVHERRELLASCLYIDLAIGLPSPESFR
jgi:hypothetical protein